MKTIRYALLQNAQGYTLTEVSTETGYHGTRNFRHTTRLTYKRLSFAEQKAHNFYRRVLYPLAKPEQFKYEGVIQENQFNGEAA